MITTVTPTPVARTRRRTSLGPIFGTGTSSSRTGPASSRRTIAFIALLHPKVDLLDEPVRLDLVAEAVGDDLPVVQHGDTIGQLERHIHVVLDDEQRDRGIEPFEQRRHPVGLGRREARRGLGEREELWSAGQRQSDLALALLAGGGGG